MTRLLIKSTSRAADQEHSSNQTTTQPHHNLLRLISTLKANYASIRLWCDFPQLCIEMLCTALHWELIKKGQAKHLFLIKWPQHVHHGQGQIIQVNSKGLQANNA